jgi:isopentenyldiphosphate isomerase
LSTLEHISVPQNDPGELLEVFDASGQGTGRAKSRAAIHLDGDWHRAFHCWILRRDDSEVVLQRRSLLKDTFPGRWDAAAAGHWRFGESPPEAAREIAEELGIEVAFDSLQYCCRERSSHDFPNGLIDREFHDVYILRSDLALSDCHPDAAEVIDVGVFRVADVIALARGSIKAMEPVETRSGSVIFVTREEMVPYSAGRLEGMLG